MAFLILPWAQKTCSWLRFLTLYTTCLPSFANLVGSHLNALWNTQNLWHRQERCYDALPQANTGPDPEGTDEVMRHRDRSHLTQITCTNNKLGPA